MEKYYLLTGFYASNIISAQWAVEELKPDFYKISKSASSDKYFIAVNFLANGFDSVELHKEKRAQIEKVCKKYYGLFANEE